MTNEKDKFNYIYEMIFNDDTLKVGKSITDSMLRTAISYNITTVDKVKDLSEDDIKDIYYKMIWKACGAEQLKYPLNLIQFENAMDITPTSAIRALQKAINEESGYGVIKTNGFLDLNTLRYIERLTSTNDEIRSLCTTYLFMRNDYYEMLSKKHTKNKNELPSKKAILSRLMEIVNGFMD